MKIACIQVEAQSWGNAEEAWQFIKDAMISAAQTHDLLVVPESVYPAYFLSPSESVENRPVKEILDEVRMISKQTNTYIAFGYAEENSNVASLFDRKGNEIARKEKTYMWHFDHRWFEPGKEVVTVETEFGWVALVICADARLPELVREAVLSGANLIIDLANLTATGPNIDQLTNAQCEYMLSTRARENQVWLAVSDKWGTETDSVTYAGRSAIYSPDGSCIAQGPSNQNTIVSAEIPLDKFGKIICESNESLPERRPELYSLLNKDTHELPVYRYLTEAIIPELITPYVTVTSCQDRSFDFEQETEHIRRLIEHEPDLVVLPSHNETINDVTRYQNKLKEGQILLLSDISQNVRRSRLITRNEILGTYLTTHSSLNKEVSEFPFVTQNQFGNIGIVHEEEMLVPEAVRCVMLDGADLIIWPHGMPFSKSFPLARTRASENRIFIAGVYSAKLAETSEKGSSFIVDPNGNMIASTLLDRAVHATGSFCALTNSRVKSVVPGTHIVFDRKPKNYRRLTLA